MRSQTVPAYAFDPMKLSELLKPTPIHSCAWRYRVAPGVSKAPSTAFEKRPKFRRYHALCTVAAGSPG